MHAARPDFQAAVEVEAEQPTFHLAIRQLKIFEARHPEEPPGQVMALLEAPRAVRHAAVDHLALLVAGLAEQVDEMVANIERRNEIAASILDNLAPPGADEPAS